MKPSAAVVFTSVLASMTLLSIVFIIVSAVLNPPEDDENDEWAGSRRRRPTTTTATTTTTTTTTSLNEDYDAEWMPSAAARLGLRGDDDDEYDAAVEALNVKDDAVSRRKPTSLPRPTLGAALVKSRRRSTWINGGVTGRLRRRRRPDDDAAVGNVVAGAEPGVVDVVKGDVDTNELLWDNPKTRWRVDAAAVADAAAPKPTPFDDDADADADDALNFPRRSGDEDDSDALESRYFALPRVREVTHEDSGERFYAEVKELSGDQLVYARAAPIGERHVGDAASELKAASKNGAVSREAKKENDAAEPNPCPKNSKGVAMFSCAPTSSSSKAASFLASVAPPAAPTCIEDHQLCDGVQDCPNSEDERPATCLLHRVTMNYMRVLTDAVFELNHEYERGDDNDNDDNVDAVFGAARRHGRKRHGRGTRMRRLRDEHWVQLG